MENIYSHVERPVILVPGAVCREGRRAAGQHPDRAARLLTDPAEDDRRTVVECGICVTCQDGRSYSTCRARPSPFVAKFLACTAYGSD